MNEQCREIEINQYKDRKYMQCKIKEISRKKGCPSTNCFKSKEGTMLIEKEDFLNRWSQYIEDIYEDDRGEKSVINKKY